MRMRISSALHKASWQFPLHMQRLSGLCSTFMRMRLAQRIVHSCALAVIPPYAAPLCTTESVVRTTYVHVNVDYTTHRALLCPSSSPFTRSSCLTVVRTCEFMHIAQRIVHRLPLQFPFHMQRLPVVRTWHMRMYALSFYKA